MNSEEIDDEPQEPAEAPPWRFTYWHAAGLMVLLGILQMWIFAALSKAGKIDIESMSWMHFALINGLSGALTAWAGASLTGFSLFDALDRAAIDVNEAFSSLLLIAGVSILASELNNLLQWLLPVSSDFTVPTNFLKENLAGVLLTVGVIAPITEEWIFRGVILDGLRSSYSLRASVLVSSVLFALVHVHPWMMVNAFLLGLLFAMIRIRTGSLLLCILIHGLYNMIPFVLTRVFSINIQGYTVTQSAAAVQFQPLWFDALGVLLLGLGLAALLRPQRPLREDFTQSPQSLP